MTDSDLHKRREILFSRFPPGQIPEAADHLDRLDHLNAEAKLEKRAVDVSYDLRHHTLETLENQLQDKGFHLDNTLMSKLVRALIYYVEETQLHNLGATERPLKQSQEAYVQAWERHPHGDHDETPPEWREYK
ncbi:hypothetical protein [Azovibrio restrictus]|uniref:hypothetical protein n=1 Tax=Azovibrio restrictus TaxID=146938 RepID=UPI0026EFA6C8|nr:hypothetical protein [Azovibrio restrictus]MDD3482242.1 hypothetical protein [Azovibrio restrictus]